MFTQCFIEFHNLSPLLLKNPIVPQPELLIFYAIAIKFRNVTDPRPLNFSISITNRKFFSDLVCRSVLGKPCLSPILSIFTFPSFRGNKKGNISWNFNVLFVDQNYKSLLDPE